MFTAAWAVAMALSVPTGAQPDPASPPHEDQPFLRLAHNLRDDMAALPSRTTAILLGIGGGAALASHAADDDLKDWVERTGPTSSTTFGRVLGDGWVQGGAALATYVMGRIADHPQTTHVGSDLVRGQVLNAVITRSLKWAAGRERPSGGSESFPSGHSSAAFTSASILHGHYGWRIGAPAYTVASVAAWSRVRDNAHWLSDVVMGATIGTVVGLTVTRGHREQTWHVVPVRTDGGFAVLVVRQR